MNIYFKFLNDWILINNSEDNISGQAPESFIENITNYNTSETNGFLKIIHNQKSYFIHYTDIQWCD